jgi:hypothetical protein
MIPNGCLFHVSTKKTKLLYMPSDRGIFTYLALDLPLDNSPITWSKALSPSVGELSNLPMSTLQCRVRGKRGLVYLPEPLESKRRTPGLPCVNGPTENAGSMKIPNFRLQRFEKSHLKKKVPRPGTSNTPTPAQRKLSQGSTATRHSNCYANSKTSAKITTILKQTSRRRAAMTQSSLPHQGHRWGNNQMPTPRPRRTE